MTPKKFTRGFFYVLGVAFTLTLLYLILEFFIRTWSETYPVVLGIVSAAILFGLFRLAQWAFTPDYNYETDPYNGPYRSRIFPTPNYFDSEEAGLLSDGRSATPHYSNGEFIGRFPQKPYADETVGDYRWAKHPEFNSWMWIYEGDPKNV
jgi:hypothetical protein